MEVVQSPSIRRIRPTNQLQLEPLVYPIPLTPIPLLDSVLRTPAKIVSQAFPTNQLQLEPLVYPKPLTPIPLLDSVL